MLPNPYEKFFQSHRVGEVIEGTIEKLNGNGRSLVVKSEGVSLLLPGKFATANPDFDLSSLVGAKERFVIVELNKANGRMVVGSADYKKQHKSHNSTWRIDASEDLHCEFKTSLIYSPKTHKPGIDQVECIAATVAAFMNSDGGTLYLGVKDNGEVVGVENDFDVLDAVPVNLPNGLDDHDFAYHRNVDGFRNKFGTILRAYLDVDAPDSRCEPVPRGVGGRTCVAVHVPRSDKAVYFRSGQLYIRADNHTRRLTNIKEATEYLSRRFNKGNG